MSDAFGGRIVKKMIATLEKIYEYHFRCICRIIKSVFASYVFCFPLGIPLLTRISIILCVIFMLSHLYNPSVFWRNKLVIHETAQKWK